MTPAAWVNLPLMLDLSVVFVVGLFFGSFFTVIALRLPEGKSIITPPSRCPECEARIRWYDNIPVVSWLVLGGKCRECGARIPFYYPLLELATGLVAAFTWYLAVRVWAVDYVQLAAVLAVTALLWLIAVIDQRTMLIPDQLSFPLAGIALLYGISPWNHLSDRLAGEWHWEVLAAGVLAAAVISVFAWFGAMGWGDVILALAMGFLLGRWTVAAFALAFAGGGAVAIVIYTWFKLTGRDTSGAKMPLGPWLCVGAWGAMFYGPQLWGWYQVNFL